MADNCTECGKCISHTQYNIYDGLCSKCYNGEYMKLSRKEKDEWHSKGSSCAEGGAD
jgi:ferredoxin